jgi:xylulokinase
MRDQYLVGVDLGTSATKSALYRPDGTLVSQASTAVPLFYPQPGVVEQDSADFYTSAARTVEACIAESGIDPRDVAAIAFDSQMAGVGSVDENYEPATRFDSWLDMRCQPYIEQIDRDHGDRVTRLTGCPPTCDHGPKMIWWRMERPAEYARVAKFLMPAAYVAGKMAGLRGEDAFIDYTFIHFSALSDAQAGAWSDELIDRLEVDRSKLPRIVAPWEVIGEVTDRAARDFGLAPGTPIAAGCGDTAAGALGAAIVRPGMLLDTAGTASVLASCTDRFTPDVVNRTLLVMRSAVPGLWHPLAYIAGGGQALRWFRDEFFGADRFDGADAYDVMSERAAHVAPGAEGLFFSPHLGGRVCPAAPQMRGAWSGFSWGHTRDHFSRAVLESVAFEYAHYLRVLSSLVPDLDLVEARVIGGGARNRVWNQIKADVLGVPYQRLARSEFATWGAAMVAGRAVGILDDLAQTAMSTTGLRGEPARPRGEATRAYQDLVDHYIAWQATFAQVHRGTAGDIA